MADNRTNPNAPLEHREVASDRGAENDALIFGYYEGGKLLYAARTRTESAAPGPKSIEG